jgi:hypothetical protein
MCGDAVAETVTLSENLDVVVGGAGVGDGGELVR